MQPNNEWLIWQLADATFPSGGLAHSSGIESAYKWDELADPDRIEFFLRDQLTQTIHTLIPIMKAAWEGPDKAVVMDQFCHAFLNNHVANRASRAQGKAFLHCNCALRRLNCRFAERYETTFQAQLMHGHYPIVFGWVTRELNIDIEKSTRLFLYISMRSMISSAIRLSIVGPLRGQSLMFRLTDFIEQSAVRCDQIEVKDMAQTAPLIELFQASQDRLYSRLYQS